MHSFTSCLIHYIWSTKNREPFLRDAVQQRLWPYLGGIARENDMRPIAIGGVADHVHILVYLPATLSVAKAAQQLKGTSSKWIHDTFPQLRALEWQEVYGAFSIGASGIVATKAYIASQRKHHRTRSFREEFIAILRKHSIKFDMRMLE